MLVIYFLCMGNAPTVFGQGVLSDSSAELKLYYRSNTIGWTTPLWANYSTIPFVVVRFQINTTDVVASMPQDVFCLILGTVFTIPVFTPARRGYRFVGWSLSPEGPVFGGNTLTVPQGTAELFAIWKKETIPNVIGKLGDGDGNDTITAFDAVVILQIVAGLDTADDGQRILCDVNKDSVVTAFDAVIILKYLAGLENTYSVGEVME